MVELRSPLEAFQNDASLFEEKQFAKRSEAIDFIEFQILEYIEDLPPTEQSEELLSLASRAKSLRDRLEAIDTLLFEHLRSAIRKANYRDVEFKALISEYIDLHPDNTEHHYEPGYDNLDILINGLSPSHSMPEQTKELEPGMVFYQKTPARVVFELAEKLPFSKEDVFYDLGSGLGQVAILIHLLTSVNVKGIEFEPTFCDYAIDCATELNISDVTFINSDARHADYSDGTIFFMYTPFRGEVLQEVLALLRKQSQERTITIVTYGSCTAQVALQRWLEPITSDTTSPIALGIFRSR